MGYPEYVGNSMTVPGYQRAAGYTTDEELLLSANNYEQHGVTLKPGQGVLLIGTGLEFEAASKRYIKATSAANVKGILRQTTNTFTAAEVAAGEAPSGIQANIVERGTLNLALVTAANSGMTLTSVLNARVDSVTNAFRI